MGRFPTSPSVETVGVKWRMIKSSPLMAAPQTVSSRPARRPPRALGLGRQRTYGWFKCLVKERRAETMPVSARSPDGHLQPASRRSPLSVDASAAKAPPMPWWRRKRAVAKGLRAGLGKAETTRALWSSPMPLPHRRPGRLWLVGRFPVCTTVGGEPGALEGIVSVWQPQAQNSDYLKDHGDSRQVSLGH